MPATGATPPTAIAPSIVADCGERRPGPTRSSRGRDIPPTTPSEATGGRAPVMTRTATTSIRTVRGARNHAGTRRDNAEALGHHPGLSSLSPARYQISYGRRAFFILIVERAKRLEFAAAGFTEIVQKVDRPVVDHLPQFDKRLIRFQVRVDDLSPNPFGAFDDRRRGQDAHPAYLCVTPHQRGNVGLVVLERVDIDFRCLFDNLR